MDAVRCLLLSFVCTCYVSCMEVNVALKKNTSTTSGEHNDWKTSGAVDGNHAILTSASSCFHSAGAPADWTVDLGQEYQLYNIIVYIRSGFKYRTANSIIYVNNYPSRVCYTFPSTISDNPTQLTCNETARYVTIRNPGNEGFDDSLNICEVEIYACAPKYRGLNCTISCNCDDCNRWAGVCYSPCRPGWEGERCDRACNGRYGSNCANSCTARQCSDSSSSCDPVNGTCDSGCQPGYTGHDCTTECSSSMYGLSCTKNCMDRHCIGNSTCDHVTGSCDQGCEPGRKSLDCTEECIEGEEFGSNCSNSCDARHCSNSLSYCDRVNGTCDSGCLAGYTGHDCTSECPSPMYGLNCSKNCMDRHCIGNSTCDHVTGSCDQGCEPGWKLMDCTKECTEGEEYGANCSGSCNARHCLNQSSCHPATGLCKNGCETGWEGPQCLQSVPVTEATSTTEGVTSTSPAVVTDAESDEALSPGIGVIAGAAAAGVLVVLVLVLLTVLLIRRKKRKSVTRSSELKQSNKTTVKKAERNDQAPVYENFALNEDTPESSNKSNRKIDAQMIHLINEAPSSTVKEKYKKGNTPEGKTSGLSTTEDQREEEEEEEEEEESNEAERKYYNLNQVDSKHLIPLPQLQQRIKGMQENKSVVKDEYEDLPQGFLYSYEASQKKENKGKNRFRGYYPYDYNRVVLHEDGTDGDYINASFIDGFMAEKRYIAAQGPYKPELFEDFWRMVWQEGCTAIVMVTTLVEAGKMKCLRYWPENVIDKYGRFTVTTDKIQQLADYTITSLTVQHDQHPKKRHIKHFYFTSWSDHDVPDISSLLTFMRRVQNSTQGQKHPIVVHCSAGIGRTGTYIAVESLINQARTKGFVDVVSFVTNMRGQRRNMVQTMEQYHFIYKAVSHALTYGDTSLSVDGIKHLDLNQLAHIKMGNTSVEEHLKILYSMKKDENAPDGFILLPSYRNRSGFTLLPPESDNEDIWNLVFNGDVRILITDSTCKEELFSPDVDVALTKGRELPLSEDVNMCDVELVNKDGERTVQIKHYQVEGEMNGGTVSVLTDSLLQGTGQQEGQTTALVSSSETECGVLVLLVNLVSRLQEEGRTDIIQEMTRLQQLMPHVTFNMDHTRRCLKFAQRWIESTELYANI